MKTLVTLYVLLFSVTLADALPDRWIIWNVGQGLMVSYVSYDKCYHFDAGGEFIDKGKFLKTCGSKDNIFSFTHWDWDHINLTRKLKRLTHNACMLVPPNGDTNPKKQRFLFLNECHLGVKKILREFTPSEYKNSNQASRVFYNEDIIIPGDTDKKSEKKWINLVGDQRLLVLAHHGSKMSTSEKFIRKSKKLKMAFSSARAERYNHPHPAIKKMLTKYGVSLIRTQVWGNLVFYAFSK